MNLRLDGQNALVCGSSQGIGKAIALQFAKMGASVTLIARNEELLKQVVSELPKDFIQEHNYIAGDFNAPEQIILKLHDIIKNGKTYSILVNNSGGPTPGPIHKASPEQLLQAFSQHVIINQMLLQELLLSMKKEQYGRIINVISISVRQPIENLGVSNTIRGAMASWSKTLARELAPFGITVNNLLPGHTKTMRLSSLIESRAKEAGVSIEDISKNMLAEIPTGRFAKPEELGYAAGFLASKEASFITGINLPVDGGFLRCM